MTAWGILRVAYQEFCELVIAGSLDDKEPMDYGSEWLIDEDGPVDDDSPEPDDANSPPPKKLFPAPDAEIPCHPAVTTFLDQVSAHFARSSADGSRGATVREGDKAISISVGEYSCPSPTQPDCPLIRRLRIQGLSITDPREFKKLRLKHVRRTWFETRLEFNLLPNELAVLATWTAEWIRGQVACSSDPPPIPIALSGEQKFFEFSGDAKGESPIVQSIAEDARAAFSSGGTDLLEIDYLWSKAAFDAHVAWKQRQKDNDAEAGQDR